MHTFFALSRTIDILEKNARATADRPPNPIAGEANPDMTDVDHTEHVRYTGDIFSNGKRILLVGHNERWSE
jgi:hypothetical protein